MKTKFERVSLLPPYVFSEMYIVRNLLGNAVKTNTKFPQAQGDDMILDDDALMEHVWARTFSYVEVLPFRRRHCHFTV